MAFCKKALHMQPGDSAVIINGRVYGPFENDEIFASEDFRLAEQLSARSADMDGMVKSLAKVFPATASANYISELVWIAASVLESAKWRLNSFAKSVSQWFILPLSLLNLFILVIIRRYICWRHQLTNTLHCHQIYPLRIHTPFKESRCKLRYCRRREPSFAMENIGFGMEPRCFSVVADFNLGVR